MPLGHRNKDINCISPVIADRLWVNLTGGRARTSTLDETICDLTIFKSVRYRNESDYGFDCMQTRAAQLLTRGPAAFLVHEHARAHS
jgi:hypothetical protein